MCVLYSVHSIRTLCWYWCIYYLNRRDFRTKIKIQFKSINSDIHLPSVWEKAMSTLTAFQSENHILFWIPQSRAYMSISYWGIYVFIGFLCQRNCKRNEERQTPWDTNTGSDWQYKMRFQFASFIEYNYFHIKLRFQLREYIIHPNSPQPTHILVSSIFSFFFFSTENSIFFIMEFCRAVNLKRLVIQILGATQLSSLLCISGHNFWLLSPSNCKHKRGFHFHFLFHVYVHFRMWEGSTNYHDKSKYFTLSP